MKKNLTHGPGGSRRKRLGTADKKMNCCANVALCKRLRLQGDQLESCTSPHKDMSKKAQEELERERITQELTMKEREVE
jgi:hypothetical protein